MDKGKILSKCLQFLLIILSLSNTAHDNAAIKTNNAELNVSRTEKLIEEIVELLAPILMCDEKHAHPTSILLSMEVIEIVSVFFGSNQDDLPKSVG